LLSLLLLFLSLALGLSDETEKDLKGCGQSPTERKRSKTGEKRALSKEEGSESKTKEEREQKKEQVLRGREGERED
jgi:hypothetical protein